MGTILRPENMQLTVMLINRMYEALIMLPICKKNKLFYVNKYIKLYDQ